MVGTSIGKAVYDLFHNKKGKAAAAAAPAGAFRPQVQAAKGVSEVPRFACVSVLKGRRRYRAAALVGNAELARLIEEKVSTLPNIQFTQVTPSRAASWSSPTAKGPWTGWKTSSASASSRMSSKASSVPSAMQKKKEGQKKEETTYLKAVHDTGAFFSSIIRNESSRFFDLRTVAALLLTLRGLRKTVFMGQRPSGPQMLWWALSLLRGR